MASTHVAASMARRTPYRRRSQSAHERDHGSIVALALVAGALLLAAIVQLHEQRRLTADPSTPLSMAQARAFNAKVPFVGGPVAPARPLRFRGTPAARLQAGECLATAALYEAGDDERGQRAVMQVVLNRVRAPGFPKTVCGVVYQGATLPTGCQFSFTCDGSLERRPERSGWAAARRLAAHALTGAVFRPVGTATHYHADWMVPYWIASLDKIAQVHSHIFYRARRAGPPG